MSEVNKKLEIDVDDAYRKYLETQVALWTRRVRDAKETLAQWHMRLHAATHDQQGILAHRTRTGLSQSEKD